VIHATVAIDPAFRVGPVRRRTFGSLERVLPAARPSRSTPASPSGALGATDVVDRHVDAFLAEPDRDGLTDAGTTAGDDCDHVLQTFHVTSFVMDCLRSH
jgi:hypothetical protein